MRVVRRVFRMVGVERMPFSAVKKALDREGYFSAVGVGSGHASS